MAKKNPLTLDEENAEKAQFAGLLKAHILEADTAIGKQQAEAAELSGSLSASLNLFEKRGGRKDAMKLMAKLNRMEPADFCDFWRAMHGYGRALGLLGDDDKPAQLDMVEQMEEQKKNSDSIGSANSAAAKASVAKPQMGAEATVQ